MIRLHETVDVPRSIDEVFAYVSNFGNAAQWDPGVAESARTGPGPIGIGTEFKLRVKFGPRSIPMTYVVREYDPPQRVVSEGKGDSVHALDDIAFAGTPQGTRITYTADISLLGAFSLVEPLLKVPLDRVGYCWKGRATPSTPWTTSGSWPLRAAPASPTRRTFPCSVRRASSSRC
jgi:carbon monoxide dehydrogenase subunit G